MDTNKFETISVKFNSGNFALWEFHFRIFVERKGLSGILDGSENEESGEKAKSNWKTKNAYVISWILNSVKPDISLSLRSFKTAAAIWDHLNGIYSQVNQSRQFELEYEIANINQEDRDIRSFYVAMLELWTEQDMISSSMI